MLTWTISGSNLISAVITDDDGNSTNDVGSVNPAAGPGMCLAQVTVNPVSQLIWIQKFPATSPPATEPMRAMAFDTARRQVVLFGAQDSSVLPGTWVWDGVTWTQEFPALSPSGRLWHAARQQVVLFGGNDSSGSFLSDTWVWDRINWTQKFPATIPAGRVYHAMTYDAARGQVVLFGGRDASGASVVGDTWVWDGVNWTQEFPAASPSGRSLHVMTYDTVKSQVVLFGGIDFILGSPFSDTWVWDGANWTQKFPTTSPPGRDSSAMAFSAVRGETVLFGGEGGIGGVVFGDTDMGRI
jgi:hypothetical protein